MTEELEALKSLKKLGKMKMVDTPYTLNQTCDYGKIETALVKYEVYKQDYERVMNEKNSLLEEFRKNQNKLKVLEIIKDRFTIQFLKSDLPNYYGIMQIGTNPIYIKTKEEFYLLKEVLL